MTAISNRLPAVVVEYDGRTGRESKLFSDAYLARSFFVAKDRDGKHPSIKKAETPMTALFNVEVKFNGRKQMEMNVTEAQITAMKLDKKRYKVLRVHKLKQTQEQLTAAVLSVEGPRPEHGSRPEAPQSQLTVEEHEKLKEVRVAQPAPNGKPKTLAEAFPVEPVSKDHKYALQAVGDPTKTEVIEEPEDAEEEIAPETPAPKAKGKKGKGKKAADPVVAKKAAKRLRSKQRHGKLLWVNEGTKTISKVEWRKVTDGGYDRWMVTYEDGTQEVTDRLTSVNSREHTDHHLRVGMQTHRDGLDNKGFEEILRKSKEYFENGARFYGAGLKAFRGTESAVKEMEKELKNKEERKLDEHEMALATKLAELANLYCTTVSRLFMLPGKLEKIKSSLNREQLDAIMQKGGINETKCTIAIIQMATKLFNKMTPRLEPGGPQVGTPELAKVHEAKQKEVQAAKAAEPKAPKAIKEPKPPKAEGEGRDQFGSKTPSQAASINAAVAATTGQFAADQIIKKTKLNGSRVKTHLKWLHERNFVTKLKDGWVLGKGKTSGKSEKEPAPKAEKTEKSPKSPKKQAQTKDSKAGKSNKKIRRK